MSALWFETALLPTGWANRVRLILAAGCIVSIESETSAAPGDEIGMAAVPGVGNLHSHAFQRAMAGLAETRSPAGDDFWTWREAMYRFVGALSPEDVEAIACQAFVEMLESGFTRVGEFHYLHNDLNGDAYTDPGEMIERIAAASKTAGIGLTLLPVFYAQGGFGGERTSGRQRRFVTNTDGYASLVERARSVVACLRGGLVGIAPHSLRAVTPESLATILPLAGGGPIHIHVAEQVAEVEACLAWSGARPVAWLLDHAAVDERWCLVHATHVDESELSAMAASGATVGLCPITEANLGDGLFPARPFLAAGGNLGVGSDSNVLIDLAEELRLLEYGQRLTLLGRAILGSGAELFTIAQAGGQRALGVDAGGLTPGAAADLVALDTNHPVLAGKTGDALLDGWIFAARGGAVDSVWRAGEQVVQGGRHHRREEIAARFRRTLARLLGL